MSDRAAILLDGLRGQLSGWIATIKRSTGATSVELAPTTSGEFVVRVSWDAHKGAPASSFEQPFTRAFVFGASMSLSPLAWRVQRRACDYARGIIRNVLEQRGVI